MLCQTHWDIETNKTKVWRQIVIDLAVFEDLWIYNHNIEIFFFLLFRLSWFVYQIDMMMMMMMEIELTVEFSKTKKKHLHQQRKVKANSIESKGERRQTKKILDFWLFFRKQTNKKKFTIIKCHKHCQKSHRKKKQNFNQSFFKLNNDDPPYQTPNVVLFFFWFSN